MQDFPETARDQILVTLELANQALAEVERDLKQKEQRVADLREFIRLGDALLGAPRPVPAPAPLPLLAPVAQTAVRQAADILAEVGHPLKLEEMYRRLQARGPGHRLPSKESLRKALCDHPTVFRRDRRGVYGLEVWERERTGVA